MRDTVEIVRGK